MRFCLDRIEGEIAVCLCEDEGNRRLDVPLADVPALRALADGTLFEAVLTDEGSLRDVRPLTAETEARRANNQARLQALLARSKKKS